MHVKVLLGLFTLVFFVVMLGCCTVTISLMYAATFNGSESSATCVALDNVDGQ